MSLATRFLPEAVNVATSGGLSLWVNQIRQTTNDGGVALFEESNGSETDREFVAAKEIRPTVSFSTSDLTVLSSIGFGGASIASGSASAGVTLYGHAISGGALPSPGSSSLHLAMAISDGVMVPTSLRAGHNTVAELGITIHAVKGTSGSSGATPIVVTASQTIPSGRAQTANIYTVGPVKYTISGGSSRLEQGVVESAVNFGIDVVREGSDGDVYPSFTGIMARDPKFEFTTKDVALIAEIGDGVSVSAFAMYFRQVNQNGQRVAAATTTHVSISATAGMITPGSTTLQHKQSGTASFTFTPSKNTNTITINVGVAIPTS